LSWSWNSWYW